VSASSSCIVYEKEDAKGTCGYYWVPAGSRYRAVPWLEMGKNFPNSGGFGPSFHGSLRAIPAADGSGGTSAFVFAGGVGSMSGKFLLVNRNVEIDPFVNVREFYSDGLGWLTDLLVVNVNRPGRIQSARNVQAMVDGIWPSVAKSFLSADSGLSVHQGPRVRWIWHHNGTKFLQDNTPYIVVKSVFNYEPHGFAGAGLFGDYKITVTIYIAVGVQNGQIGAAAHRYHCHVSAGSLSTLVNTIADLSCKLVINDLNNVSLPAAASAVNQQIPAGRVLTDVVLLPDVLTLADSEPIFILGNTVRAGNADKGATLLVEHASAA
jgi:hypothetical protein